MGNLNPEGTGSGSPRTSALSADDQLWRYMTWPGFLFLLEYSQLSFYRCDLYTDQHEGVVARADTEYARESERDIPEFGAFMIPALPEVTRKLGAVTFINCWHRSAHESTAMWSSYADGGKCLAVRTSVEKLKAQLPNYVHVAAVNYIDPETHPMQDRDVWFWPGPFLNKRCEYAAEQEVRALIFNSPPEIRDHGGFGGRLEDLMKGQPANIQVDVDLQALVGSVVLGPAMPDWQRTLVDRLAKSRGLNVSVSRSVLGI